MEIIHLLFFPALTLLLPVVLQYFLSEDELFSYFKIYVLGFAGGLLVNVLFFGIGSFFAGKSHFSTIVTKTVIVDGVLFVLVIAGLFYGIVYKIVGSKIKLNLLNMSLLSIPVLLGYYSVLTIFQFSGMAIPNSPLVYTSILALISLISLSLALMFGPIVHVKSMILKIITGLFLFLVLTAVVSSYKVLFFYNYVLYSYFPVLLSAIVFLALFIFLKLKKEI